MGAGDDHGAGVGVNAGSGVLGTCLRHPKYLA